MASPPAYASVVFDCDSTLVTIEGIDELCAGLPLDVAQGVAALTEAAMDGDVPLEAVYARRLEIVRPSRRVLEDLGRRYVETLVPGAAEVVALLADRAVDVHVVSGGLAPAVRILARHLGLADAAVHAVEVGFDDRGGFAGFDRASPLVRSRGKVEVLAGLRARRPPLLFVGDGVSDLEAREVVDRFVGFGGVARRAAVERGADRYVVVPDLGWVLDEVFPGAVRGSA